MDPDLLRLLLVVLGVLLVLGIYLWDRYRRASPRAHNRRVKAEPVAFDEATDDHDRDLDASPVTVAPTPPGHEAGARVAALDPDPREIGDWSDSAAPTEPQLSMGLHFDAHGDGDYLNTNPALLGEVERKLIVMHLAAARGGAIRGRDIERACAAVQLALGDMSIYHRHDGATGQVLFSIASMVEPGTFPADGMATFETPGLTLFTQLPGARDGTAIYADMLETADRLAGLLRVEIQDDRHNRLTRQMRDHMRESIIEHRRKLRLARSRH
jgi:cell division protein ZipA